MKRVHLIFLLGLIVLSSCKDQKETNPNLAQQVVDKAINAVGGPQIKNSVIEFDFRDRHYIATRKNWKFQYERIWADSLGEIRDVLSNSGFQRFIKDSAVVVADSMAVKYTSSLNSVHYFSILPFGLNDKAVNKTYLGEVKIKGKAYHKIEVTFNEEGGGEDFDDVFVYWISKDTYEVDYLSYSFEEGPGDTGLRFREAYNRRGVNGLYFSDYNNYKTEEGFATVSNLDSLYVANKLELLSKIELEAIKVNLLPTSDR
ncbi:DUF6503 family protein [Flavobacteriaceae bacterium LMO-SS05]